jgi:hypothetical protein
VLLVAIVVVAQVNQSKKEERNKKMLESIQDWFKENQNGASDPSGTPADFGAFFPWFFKKLRKNSLLRRTLKKSQRFNTSPCPLLAQRKMSCSVL